MRLIVRTVLIMIAALTVYVAFEQSNSKGFSVMTIHILSMLADIQNKIGAK